METFKILKQVPGSSGSRPAEGEKETERGREEGAGAPGGSFPRRRWRPAVYSPVILTRGDSSFAGCATSYMAVGFEILISLLNERLVICHAIYICISMMPV